MFTSSNPFPSSVHGLPPSGIFLGQEKDGVYFNHHPFFDGEYSSFHHSPHPPTVKESGLQNCHNNNNNNNNNSNNNNNHNNNHMKHSDSVISPSRKRVAASKKDRHSKIFTAQGPRDRRVRLSIDISKKFFGLQDLLGFDKASKTLDWLFTRSKGAIKDLVEEMRHTSSSTLSDQCEEVFMEKGEFADNNGRKKNPVDAKCINGSKRNHKCSKQKQRSKIHVNLAARTQMRAEARSRARERTLEKLRVKKLNNDVKNVVGESDYCYLQSACGDQVQSQSNHEVKIGEALTLQKLPKPYSLLYNSHHNYVDSKDSRFKNSTH